MTEALENQSQHNLEASLAQVHWVLVTALGLLPDIAMEHKQKSPLDQGASQNQIRNRIESGVAVSGCAFAEKPATH